MSLQEVRIVEILSEEIVLIKPESKVCYFVLNLIKNALTKKNVRQVSYSSPRLLNSTQFIFIYLVSVTINTALRQKQATVAVKTPFEQEEALSRSRLMSSCWRRADWVQVQSTYYACFWIQGSGKIPLYAVF